MEIMNMKNFLGLWVLGNINGSNCFYFLLKYIFLDPLLSDNVEMLVVKQNKKTKKEKKKLF